MAAVDDIDLRVSERLRELRSERGITLSVLAEQTGISAPHLSAWRRASGSRRSGRCCNSPASTACPSANWSRNATRTTCTSCAPATPPRTRARTAATTVLSGTRATISVVRVELAPGKPTKVAEHVGEEWLHVESGNRPPHRRQSQETLEAGDCVQFNAARPHRLSAANRRSATVLIASTAATVPMRHPVPR